MDSNEDLLREEHEAVPQSGRLGRVTDKLAIIPAMGLVAAMLILIQEVVLRYVFGRPTIWAHETTVFLCAISFIYGGLLCTARDRHIRVVLIYDILSPAARRVADILISAICGISAAAFAWAAWQMVKRAAWRPDGSFHLETSGSAWNPAYPGILKILLMVALAIMALQFAILAINYARGRKDAR